MPEPSVSAGEVTALLRMVRGVADARVSFGEDGDLERIDISVHPGHSTRRIIRDVESALYTGLGIVVDHRTISIGGSGNGTGTNGRKSHSMAQDLQQSEVDGPKDARARIELVRVVCEPDGELFCEVAVELDVGEARHAGKARDADTPRTRWMAAGRATIEALYDAMERETAFALEGIEEFAICEQPALIAAIRARQGRSQRSYVGTALVEGSREETAARAVLDALNRFWDAESVSVG